MRSAGISAALACLAWLACAPAAPAHGQDAGPSVTVIVPGDIDGSVDRFTVDVVAENVVDLGAFQFVLTFDAQILRAESIKIGDFLGATVQEVVCDDPTIDDAAVRLACGRRPASAGVDGTGSLATITFEARGSGTATLALSRVTLIHSNGTPFEAKPAGAEVTVTREPSSAARLVQVATAAFAIVVLALLGVVLLRRRASRRGA